MTRTEKDSLGSKEIPDIAYYGIQTARAVENFPVSGERERPELVRAYVLVKKAAALANLELGALDRGRGEAIIRAADEVLDGKLADQFVVDVFQAGAGTSFNMNVNEVLANRALEILGHRKGDYARLSPNDQANMAQSTNDTFPTASHLAVLEASRILLQNLSSLADAFRRNGEEFARLAKPGRTHLMDALPVTLGAEFDAYATAVERSAEWIRQRRGDLREIALGGTATGTGANTPEGYRAKVIGILSGLSGEELQPARNGFEALQSLAPLGAFSGSLRELSLELGRIANDLRLLGSGPTSGFAEIELPAVQPGSSIMAGKVNPVLAECLNMVCFQVVGADTTVALAVQAGQLELNVMTPVVTRNILSSIALLNNFLPVFTVRCVEGIRADADRCRALAERNPAMATLLSPKIGYLEASKLASEARERDLSVAELAVMKGILTKEEAEELLDPLRAARARHQG
jgi:aspartate ammonia-lyase